MLRVKETYLSLRIIFQSKFGINCLAITLTYDDLKDFLMCFILKLNSVLEQTLVLTLKLKAVFPVRKVKFYPSLQTNFLYVNPREMESLQIISMAHTMQLTFCKTTSQNSPCSFTFRMVTFIIPSNFCQGST